MPATRVHPSISRRRFLGHCAVVTAAATVGPWGCKTTPATDTEFLILGGGMAGLNLAWQLQQAGKDYILLEGNDRLGGRMYTHPTIGRDVGGRGIGDKYTEAMKLIRAFDVPLRDITDALRSPSSVYLDGKLYPKWEETDPAPNVLEYSRLKNVARELTALDRWFQEPALDQPYAEFLRSLGHTEAEIARINISSNYNDVATTSALNAYHSRAFRKFNGSERVYNLRDGARSLVDAVGGALDRPVHLRKVVTDIRDESSRVVVSCADGSSYRAKRVVSTLPFTTLRAVKIDAPLSGGQRRLIDELPYTTITQIHLAATEPYWETDGAPVSTWTDTPLERIMTHTPGTTELVCWVNGRGTAFFDGMSEREVADYTLKKLAEIRPASAGKVEYLGTHSWGRNPFSRGAYAEFAVGQPGLFAAAIRPAGNLHFAGEHAARADRGIEGAAASATRVFNELIPTT